MKSRTKLWLAGVAAALPLALLAGLLVYVGVLTQCEPENGAGSPVDLSAVPSGPIGAMGWRGTQLVNAAYIMNTALDLGLSRRDQTIGVMTAMGESSLTVIDHGDAAGPDSRGLFQQRALGWGSYECRMNPTCSAQSFFRALMKVDGRDSMRPTIVAHTVQRNADPEHYTKFWPDAEQVVAALAGATGPGADGSNLALGAAPRSSSGALTVMSYNLLGQSLSRVKWPTRAAAISRLILSVNPDVLGVQENHQWRGQGQAQLLNLPGMTWVLPDHRNAIAFRSSLGQVVDEGTIRLATMGVFGAYHDRFAVWAKVKTSTGVLLLVNVHTENGNTARAAKVRSRGYDRLLAGLAKVNPANAIPTIMTGDFNASDTETRAIYRDHLTKLGGAGFVDAARQAPSSTKIAGVKSYNGLKSKAGKIRTGKKSGHLDYIWTAGDARATGWQIALPPITWRSVGGRQTAFVSEVTSDHWPVVAKVASGAAGNVSLGDCNPEGGEGGPLPGFDGATCVPSGSGAENGLQATARRGLRCIASVFPEIKSMGGRRSGSSSTCSFSDHCVGLAVDFMVPRWNTPEGKALGWRIARWVQANAKQLRVKMIIWDAQKWNPSASSQWRPYVHPYGNSNATLAHRDHVHVSFLASASGT
jgi:endonuclease/exonuclease/phosphatase family metal-dependent hydrolase